MSKYTPVFMKDLNEYIVPSPELAQDTPELADYAGIGAGLAAGYGLNYTGKTVEITDSGYAGPFVIATIADKQAWIIGGPSLVELLAARNPAVENLPTEEPTVIGIDLASGPDKTVIMPLTEDNSVPVVLNGDATGPDGV